MGKKMRVVPQFPKSRNGFAMNIDEQDLVQLTGLPDQEKGIPHSSITRGEWSNNWLPPEEPDPEAER